MFAEKPRHARVEVAVNGCPVEARRHVVANARYGGCELRRARRQESNVARRQGVNVVFIRAGSTTPLSFPSFNTKSSRRIRSAGRDRKTDSSSLREASLPLSPG